jgi:hypothetical protein
MKPQSWPSPTSSIKLLTAKYSSQSVSITRDVNRKCGKEQSMTTKSWTKGFLLATLALAWLAYGGTARAEGLCTGQTEETCADNGCENVEPAGHYACTWSVPVEHCGCSLQY